jgi:hypothetical protein
LAPFRQSDAAGSYSTAVRKAVTKRGRPSADCGILADALGIDVFVLVHLAAGVGDRQCDTARTAGAGIDDRQRITKAVAMGAALRSGDAPNGGIPTHCCISSWMNC